MVRCGSAGAARPAPVMQGLPVPPVPTGLLARALDPLVLDQLGYERDKPVCAVLEGPSTDELAAAAEDAVELVRLHEETGREVLRIGGRCGCEIARALDERELVDGCQNMPSQPACDTAGKRDQVAAALAPLLDAIAARSLPWIHWRLVGPTDRPGWFAEHLPKLVSHHAGGTTVYLRDAPLDRRADPLVPILRAVEDVVAVVVQDNGRAVLVAREQGGMLVLDHFAQAHSSARRLALVDRIELTHATAMVAALSRPGASRALLVDPRAGALVELDPRRLEDLDRLAIALSPLSETYVVGDEERSTPPRLVDRVAVQAPYGRDGAELEAIGELSAEGIAWAQGVSDAPLVSDLPQLGLGPELPSFVAPEGTTLPFVLRGTATELDLIHGLAQAPAVLRSLENAHPGALAGTLSAWKVTVPAGPLPADLAGQGAPFSGVRELLATRSLVLTSSFDPKRTRITLRLAPK